MTNQTTHSTRLRYRMGTRTSKWMTVDELKDAAASGRLDPLAEIQSAGQNDWIPASDVRGLDFPTPEPEAEEVEAKPERTSSRRHEDTHPRFKTMRDLLNTFLHMPVSINLIDPEVFEDAELCLACEDHFEINLPMRKMRAFLPYSRIKMVATLETEQDGGSTYRDTHRVTIEVEACHVID